MGFLSVDPAGHPGLSGDAQTVASAASLDQPKARELLEADGPRCYDKTTGQKGSS